MFNQVPEPTPQMAISYPAVILFVIVLVIIIIYFVRRRNSGAVPDTQWIEDE